jgi:hypothetical protein
MHWEQGTPQAGAPVRVKVGFYYHYGIFVDENSVIQFGLPDGPSRPAADIQVLSTDVYTFLQGGTLELGIPDRAERKRLRSASCVIAAAQSRIGQGGYDLLHNNCEHFMYECLFGQPDSPTISSLRTRIRQKLGKE